MNTKNIVILALLAGIGVVLHTVMPSFLGIKPDMMLAMMFLGIILIPEIKSVLLLGDCDWSIVCINNWISWRTNSKYH